MFRYGEMYEKLNEIREKPWLGRMKPFRVVGNVYFVGTYQASTHIIDTGAGLIMIDPGYHTGEYLVMDSMHRLGLDPEDIKYIICTHWHGDHTEGVRAFAGLSGAKTVIGRLDCERARRYFDPDILVDDGDTLTLGNTTVRFVHTPGQTLGTMSLFFDTEDEERTLRVGTFGGAGLNTMVKGKFDFEGCREAYFASLKKLEGEKVDVFIGNHTWNNDTYEKGKRLLSGGENEFIDSEIFGRFLSEYERRLTELIAKEV